MLFLCMLRDIFVLKGHILSAMPSEKVSKNTLFPNPYSYKASYKSEK